jgi:hypothetical protein
MATLTVNDLIKMVCACLKKIGAAPAPTPDDEAAECADWDPDELDLDAEALVQLFACIDKKVKAKGQTVVIGKTMWRKSKSVRDFCEALAENLE